MADDDDQDLDNQNDDAEDQDDSGDDADWKPPATKAEFMELVKKAGNPEAAKWRRRATGKDPNWKPNGQPDRDTTKPPAKPTGDDDKLTPDQIRAAAREELQAEFQTRADKDNLRAEVSVALMTAGLNLSEEELASPAKARKAVARVVNMIDLDKLVLDDGNIEGLDDELTELKKSLPGLFKASGQGPAKPKTRGGDVAARSGGPKGGDDEVAQLAKAWFSGSS